MERYFFYDEYHFPTQGLTVNSLVRYSIFILMFLITSCNTARIKFVNVDHKTNKDNPITNIKEKKSDSDIDYAATEANGSETLLVASNSIEPSFIAQKQNSVSKKNPVYKRTTARTRIASAFPVQNQIIVSKKSKEKDAGKMITTGNKFFAIALATIIIAIIMLALTVTSGAGLPFFYFFIISGVFQVLGLIKRNNGFKIITDYSGDKEALLKKYKLGKALGVISFALICIMAIGMIVFMFALLGATVGQAFDSLFTLDFSGFGHMW